MNFLRLPLGDGEHVIVNADFISAMSEVNGTTIITVGHGGGTHAIPMCAHDIMAALGNVLFGEFNDRTSGV